MTYETLWDQAARLNSAFLSNRFELARVLVELKRQTSDARGEWTAELRRHGIKPSTARSCIRDYMAKTTGGQTDAAKRKHARQAKKAAGVSWKTDHPLLPLMDLMTFEDAKALFKIMARRCHPDCGGTNEQMQRLNAAWERVQEFYAGQTADVVDPPWNTADFRDIMGDLFNERRVN